MSSGSLPGRSASQKVVTDKEGLILHPIRKKEETVKGGSLLPIAVLTALWIYYALFGWLWLELFTAMGDDLLWAYFGLFTVVACAMALGVAKSMSAQRIGAWEAKKSKKKDERGTCCGFQVY